MQKSLNEKLQEDGYRFASEREGYAYIGSIMTGVESGTMTPKVKEEKIREMNRVRRERGVDPSDFIVPIEFKIAGE